MTFSSVVTSPSSLPAAFLRLAAVPVPPRCAALPRDPHGLPIPFTTALTPEGTPCWDALDGDRWQDAVGERLCSLCGQRLDGGVCVFIGGDLCALTRDFADPPMHPDCARYAVHASPLYALPPHAFRLPAHLALMPVAGVADGGARIGLFETTTQFREVWRDLPEGRAPFLHVRRVYKTEWYPVGVIEQVGEAHDA